MPPYFRAGAGVRLLERLEDDLLLVRRDADAGVGDFERTTPEACRTATRWSSSIANGWRRRQVIAAVLGELEGVRQQVLEDLVQPLGIGDDARGSQASRSTERFEVLGPLTEWNVGWSASGGTREADFPQRRQSPV